MGGRGEGKEGRGEEWEGRGSYTLLRESTHPRWFRAGTTWGRMSTSCERRLGVREPLVCSWEGGRDGGREREKEGGRILSNSYHTSLLSYMSNNVHL